mmetsp:Transcript_78498/g.91772  ORF Transcript_78498/g.91772 Transcript_78498/m.91772 type:complete len:302 (+) Transcript_78498:435-1340(+)
MLSPHSNCSIDSERVLKGTLRQVVAEGAHHNLRQRIRKEHVQLIPGAFNEITCLNKAIVDGTDLVEHSDHGGDFSMIVCVLLHNRPNVLAIKLVEAAHALDDGVGDLPVTNVLSDFLEVALETLKVQSIVNNLECKTQVGAEVLKGLAHVRWSISDHAGKRTKGTGSTTRLVHVDSLQRVEQTSGVTRLNDVGHHVMQTRDVKALTGVAGAKNVKVQLVHLSCLRGRQVAHTCKVRGHEIASCTRVDSRRNAVLQVDCLSSTAYHRFVLNVVNDERANVKQLRNRDVAGSVKVILVQSIKC